MQSKRSERVGELILEFVSELMAREINDPRVGIVTLTNARVTKDLRRAWVYFSILAEGQEKEKACAGLRSATGFIRAKMARELKLRYVPTLEFVYDETPATAQRIEGLLRRFRDSR